MAYVLAGGRGSRLLELTDRRAKPAVFFGCKSRIIDFASFERAELGHSPHRRCDQYKAHSLIRHLQRGWNFFRPERNESFDILPASQRVSEKEWYAGTADAVYQNIDIIESYAPRHIIILAGDHIYKMDYEPMLQQHVAQNADVTCRLPGSAAGRAQGFGVMHVDASDRILSFVEKPKDPPAMPGKPDTALASMGVYVFETAFLIDQLRRDAADPNSARDFGRDIIPYLVRNAKAVAHPYSRSCVRSPNQPNSYWRDVGTLDAYWSANMDLTDVVPELDLYDQNWPIWTFAEITPRQNLSTIWTVGKDRRFPRWFRAAASFPAQMLSNPCCSPERICTPIRASKTQSSFPMSKSRGPCGCATSSLTEASYSLGACGG
jgi:glucose-1-phosphate adenylyltransferase